MTEASAGMTLLAGAVERARRDPRLGWRVEGSGMICSGGMVWKVGPALQSYGYASCRFSCCGKQLAARGWLR